MIAPARRHKGGRIDLHHYLTSIGLMVMACAIFSSTAVADSHEMADDANATAESSATEEDTAELDMMTASADEPVTTPLSSIVEAGDFSSAPDRSGIDHWNQQNPWRYGTDYLFPLTRGLEGSGLPDFLRPVAMVFTLPFDLGNLPLGAVAGLFGS